MNKDTLASVSNFSPNRFHLKSGYREAGRFTEALSTGAEAIELCERHGFVARLGTVLLQTGGTHCRLGETERGLTETRRGLELWRKTSSRLHMSHYLSDFADNLLRAREYDEAEKAIREGEQVVAETDERSHVGELLRLRGLLLTLSGKVADGTPKLWGAVEWAQSRNTRLFELRALRDLTRPEISQHERKKAATALRQVIAWFPNTLQFPDLREAREALDRIEIC